MPLGEWRLFYFGVVLSDNIWCNIEFQSDAVEYVILFDTIKIILFPSMVLRENVVCGGLFLFLLVDVCPKAMPEKISETTHVIIILL